jgi:hypothetical protein
MIPPAVRAAAEIVHPQVLDYQRRLAVRDWNLARCAVDYRIAEAVFIWKRSPSY